MKQKYVQYGELLKREQDLNRLERHGVKLLYSKNRFKQVVGVGCLVVAVIPNGTGFFMFPLGFALLGISLRDVAIYKDNLRFKIWLRFNRC